MWALQQVHDLMRKIVRQTILMQKGVERQWWGPFRRWRRKVRKDYTSTVVSKSFIDRDVWPL